MSSSKRVTRSCECPDVDFPPFDPINWKGSGHLPNLKEVIGAIRFSVSTRVSSSTAADIVAKILVNHWIQRNVYTKAHKNVLKKLEYLYKEFVLLKKIFLKGNPTEASIQRYLTFKESTDKALDISTEDRERIRILEDEYNVRMTKAETEYLSSQLDPSVPRSGSGKIVCYAKMTDLDTSWVE